MGRHAVAQVDELEEGKVRTVEAAGRSIMVVKWEGAVFALRNLCPHQSQSFAGSYVRPWVYGAATQPPCSAAGGDAGGQWELHADNDAPVVQCPWHSWEFRLKDGRCASDPQFRVRSYPTEIDPSGTVFIDTTRR
jgi:nitrite reductase/ring-hydroxylating ferredoxin subunit